VSHITKRKSSMKDIPTIKKACKRTGAEFRGIITKGRGVTGRSAQIKFDSWHHPVAINLQSGECSFDNYGGRWGKEELLDGFKQQYAVATAETKAESNGQAFETERLPGGAIKCTVAVGGSSGPSYDTGGSGTSSGYGV